MPEYDMYEARFTCAYRDLTESNGSDLDIQRCTQHHGFVIDDSFRRASVSHVDPGEARPK